MFSGLVELSLPSLLFFAPSSLAASSSPFSSSCFGRVEAGVEGAEGGCAVAVKWPGGWAWWAGEGGRKEAW